MTPKKTTAPTYFSAFPVYLIGLLLLLFSCRKENTFSRNAETLRFSADTVYLDTVFTGVGSSTRELRVFNPTNENLIVNSIGLGKGAQSPFRLNVNGASTVLARDVEILAGDSIYLFVEVTANTGGAFELLFTDSIVFNTGGNVQDVKLVTLARDAYFHYPDSILEIAQDPFPPLRIPYSFVNCNAVWQADKPHVVYGYAVIPNGCQLQIEAGAQVHFHNNSGLWVANGGSLKVDPNNMGDYENPVVFQGDRLEPFYRDIPGQWGGVLGGLFFQGQSVDNVINNAIVKNATTGIRLDSNTAAQPNVLLNNVRVWNHSRVGIYGGYGNLQAQNVVVANCGLYGFYALGGSYSFLQSTFANYWSQSNRSTPVIGLVNFFEFDSEVFVRNIEKAYFGNCIVYGRLESEFGVGEFPTGFVNYEFDHGLMRLNPFPEDNSYDINDATRFKTVTFNMSPNFIDTDVNNYELDTLSPAMNTGSTGIGIQVPLDIKGQLRSFGGLPDLGAYERIE